MGPKEKLKPIKANSCIRNANTVHNWGFQELKMTAYSPHDWVKKVDDYFHQLL